MDTLLGGSMQILVLPLIAFFVTVRGCESYRLVALWVLMTLRVSPLLVDFWGVAKDAPKGTYSWRSCRVSFILGRKFRPSFYSSSEEEDPHCVHIERARPKSQILIEQSSLMRTFAGFISLCSTWESWRYLTATKRLYIIFWMWYSSRKRELRISFLMSLCMYSITM